MATRGIVPRANGEGSIGTEEKHWGEGFFRDLFVGGKAIQEHLKDLGVESSYAAERNGWIKFGSGILIQWLHVLGNSDFDPPIAFKGFDAGVCAGNTTVPQYAGLTYDEGTGKFHVYASTQDPFWLYAILIGRWK